ncbi:MAG: D-glycero-D-manno-heptose 1,7-bisphosphate phosphatase [Candidatus Omnitrophota bacterium]|jgi:D-glycero-D-manno-heptose 1,7-bisphosphate phosphatase
MAKKIPKIIFLDRDGVINEFPGNGRYVTKVKDFHFIPGSLEAIKRLTDEGFIIFVVSNQAGVGKGIYTKQKLAQINKKMLTGIKKVGGKVKKAYYATARSDEGSPLRKPNIGSVKLAMKLLGMNLASAKHAYFVGDTESDIQTGKNAGMKTIFVLSGREDCVYMRRWDDLLPDYIFKNLYEATKLLTGKDGEPHIIKRYSKFAKRKTNKVRRREGINYRRRYSDKF